MCGIAGQMRLEPGRDIDSSCLRRMTDCLSHRGPDDEGFFIGGPVGLGHRRLAIIDLATGHQPMIDARGAVLIFNGEIYNYIELRDELRSFGHAFHTESDSEVILVAYRQWGEGCFSRLNGMWALALWDPETRVLLLSRDRIGEKPLYYATHDRTFYFGSEIKSILAAGFPQVPDLTLLELYLCLSYVPAPYTFFCNIKSLLPGHYLVVSGESVVEKEYWDLPEIDEHNMLTDRPEVYARFEELLTDSVRIRMRSDVPYGAFLSGGLDSSSIVAIMSEISSHPVETFTIGFEDRAFDERPLARQVAAKFGTHHHEAVVEPDSFEESLERVLRHYDDPFGDSSAIPTGYVSQYARREVKMVLTGDGGDEVLSGYTMYQGGKFAGRYRMLPAPVRFGIPLLLQGTSSVFRGGIRYRLNRSVNVVEASNLDFKSRLIAKITWGNYPLIKDLLRRMPVPMIPIEEFIGDLMKTCPFRDPFYRIMYYNLKNSLPNDMLVKVDRMSMAHSLETRLPFLDHRLVEFMAGVHKDVKMEGYERKSILRRTVGKRLPPDLLRARKQGFGVPLREWFKTKDFEGRLEELTRQDAGLDRGVLQSVVSDTIGGRKDYGNFIWMLFVMQRWLGAEQRGS